MEQITNNWQIKDTSEPTPTLFQLYKKLGERNRAAKTVVERMTKKGTVVALNTVYNVIYGRSSRTDCIGVACCRGGNGGVDRSSGPSART